MCWASTGIVQQGVVVRKSPVQAPFDFTAVNMPNSGNPGRGAKRPRAGNARPGGGADATAPKARRTDDESDSGSATRPSSAPPPSPALADTMAAAGTGAGSGDQDSVHGVHPSGSGLPPPPPPPEEVRRQAETQLPRLIWWSTCPGAVKQSLLGAIQACGLQARTGLAILLELQVSRCIAPVCNAPRAQVRGVGGQQVLSCVPPAPGHLASMAARCHCLVLSEQRKAPLLAASERFQLDERPLPA